MHFSLEERRIFRYFNGIYDGAGSPRVVARDPMVIYRTFVREMGGADIDTSLKNVLSDNPVAVGLAADQLVPAVHAAFGTAPLAEDGSGLSEAEAVQLLTEFLEWISDVKKNTAASRLSSAPTVPSPASDSDEAPEGPAGPAPVPPDSATSTSSASN